MNNKDLLSERIVRESQLINLLLNSKTLVSDFIEKAIPIDYFSEEYHLIIMAIVENYEKNNVLLTIENFEEYKKKISSIQKKIQLDIAFSRCFSSKTKFDNFPLLIDQIIQDAIREKFGDTLAKASGSFSKGEKSIEIVKKLISDCEGLVSGVASGGNSYYENILFLTKDRIKYIEDVRSGKIIEEPPLLTGIKEVDDTMVTGLEKGTLTLFCADVGGFKSAMLANIALNVWKQGHNVLFVPLEMHRDQMWRRFCARETRIDSKLITRDLKGLTDEQMEKIRSMEDEWGQRKSCLYIMENQGRTSILTIEKEIQRHIKIFAPRLVIIDYVANLESHIERYGRNDLEIGDMLKGMREMGKQNNFAVISAAQLGRDALKRLRKDGANKDKPQVNSEDIRGSHEYAADADNIYAMLKNSQQPGSQIYMFCVKARNGKTYFDEEHQKIRASLNVMPQYGLIFSSDENVNGIDEAQLEMLRAETEANSKEIVKKKDTDSFFDEEKDWDKMWDAEEDGNKEENKKSEVKEWEDDSKPIAISSEETENIINNLLNEDDNSVKEEDLFNG